MALDLEEQEQVDEFKAWWGQNGKKVIVAATLFVLIAAGVQGWRWWNDKQQQKAFALYDQALQHASSKDAKAVKQVTGAIMDGYGSTGYASLSAWLAGRTNLEAGDRQSALAQFQYALEHARDDASRDLARIRLAALKLDSGDADGAAKLLAEEVMPAYTALAANLKGDALLALKRPAEARAAWQQAFAAMNDTDPLKALVEIKMDSGGAAP
jgi:predicted negative regulator of RcsB-dependent stress response